ncbi:TPA: hypothetical protein ACGRYF_002991 [Pseudomonas aeruginosa]
MNASQPLTHELARVCGPFDLASTTAHQDFLHCWRRGAKLLGLPLLQLPPARHWEIPVIEDAHLPQLLKAFRTLDMSRQVLLLTPAAACPGAATLAVHHCDRGGFVTTRTAICDQHRRKKA